VDDAKDDEPGDQPPDGLWLTERQLVTGIDTGFLISGHSNQVNAFYIRWHSDTANSIPGNQTAWKIPTATGKMVPGRMTTTTFIYNLARLLVTGRRHQRAVPAMPLLSGRGGHLPRHT